MASTTIERDSVLEVRNPRTGQADYRLPVSSRPKIAATAARLRGHQPAWAALPVEARKRSAAEGIALTAEEVEMLERLERAPLGTQA